MSESSQKIAEGGKTRARQSFRVVLIKPSHYDDDGYVIQWYRSAIPSNTLASLYGLVKGAAQSHALGPEIDIVIDAYDETNTIIPIKQIVADIEAADQGVVGLVGVQTNQFPRAVDIARRLRERGIQVAIGGFHVSGCIAMLPELPADIQEAMYLGITFYAGECENRIEEFLNDAWNGEMK
ncbi:MAG: radical SAM protein, partial [Methyloligellaceae bacterium]